MDQQQAVELYGRAKALQEVPREDGRDAVGLAGEHLEVRRAGLPQLTEA